MAHLRYRGQDPAHGGKAARQRGKRVKQESQKRAACNRAHQQEHDDRIFKREVLPHLRNMSLNSIARVTGLSRGYCPFIRRGVRIPHPRHWEAMRDLVQRREVRSPTASVLSDKESSLIQI